MDDKNKMYSILKRLLYKLYMVINAGCAAFLELGKSHGFELREHSGCERNFKINYTFIFLLKKSFFKIKIDLT